MISLFGRPGRAIERSAQHQVVLDLSDLEDGEAVRITIQKVELVSFYPRYAKAETDILPGAMGRVSCGGSSWYARNDGELKIRSGQSTIVLGREKEQLRLVVIGEDQ